jgi:hypothetical protein
MTDILHMHASHFYLGNHIVRCIELCFFLLVKNKFLERRKFQADSAAVLCLHRVWSGTVLYIITFYNGSVVLPVSFLARLANSGVGSYASHWLEWHIQGSVVLPVIGYTGIFRGR